MSGQVDRLREMVARSASRRRVLRGALVGLVGVVAATALAGSHLVAAEASGPTPGASTVQQATARLDQTPPSLKQIQERLFQARPGLQQQLTQRAQANASQRPASANRAQRQVDRQRSVGADRPSRPSSLQAQRTPEQIRAELGQRRQRFDQRGLPGLTRTSSH